MDKVNLYFDCDGVILNSIQSILAMYELETGIKIDYKDVVQWDFSETLTKWDRNKINDVFSTNEFWDYACANEGFPHLLNQLYKDKRFRLIMVSNGTVINIKNKNNFIEKYLPYFDMYLNPTFPKRKYTEEISFLSNAKAHVNMKGGIFIDDSMENLKSSNASLKLCFSSVGWNKSWNKDDESFNYAKCNNTEDIMNEIERFYEVVRG